MPRVTHNPDAEAVLYVRVPGHLKEAIASAADAAGLSLNAWCANILRLGLLEGRGIPLPPRAHAPLPTVDEVVAAYVRGEQVVTPCGRVGICSGTTESPEVLHGVGWCRGCGIRLG
jgi:hypothetical protein